MMFKSLQSLTTTKSMKRVFNIYVNLLKSSSLFCRGIELRDDHGGEPIHYICIFPEDCDLSHVWTTIQGRLGLTSAAIQDKGGDERVYIPIEEGATVARELGGVVSIHAGAKSNSIEGIRNQKQFQQRIKYDIARQWVDLMEIGQLKDINVQLEGHLSCNGT